RAMVMGRPVRVSVFRTREAPEEIETLGLPFRRVLDNILTNAVKYTPRGSIIVEIDGRPDQLTVRVSDTGRGISSERLERVFMPGEADPTAIIGRSHGVGLSF